MIVHNFTCLQMAAHDCEWLRMAAYACATQVLAINTLAPFILNSRLRCLLEASPETHTFVINVSAMEGKFYRRGCPLAPSPVLLAPRASSAGVDI